ncbi:hypothetical protein DW954_02265 [Clostridium sp. AM45-5]|nr:DNA polymerase III subunit beta [Clostridium sp. AM45-5]RHS68181.1 hypothetical protein DW954_02265 [Clostridium sp. AM45-5]
MLSFSITSKELEAVVKKANSALDNKSVLTPLRTIYFRSDDANTLMVTSTNISQWLEVRTDRIWNCRSGIFGIESEDMKLILKMSGNVTFEDISMETENKISVKCGKRELTVNKVCDTDYVLPAMGNDERGVLETTESWLYDTVTKLTPFTSKSDVISLQKCINFDTKTKRVTALDGSRLALKKMENVEIITERRNINMDAALAFPVLRAVLNKMETKRVLMSIDKTWICIKGNDFTYMIHHTDGVYYDVDKILSQYDSFSCVADKEKLLETVKYSKDIIGKEKTPFVLHRKNEKLYSYTAVAKYEVLEELEVNDLRMDDMYIAFNPSFWVDALNTVDTDTVKICGGRNIDPLMIYGNEYDFLILPVRINNLPLMDKVTKKFEKVA